MALPGMLAPPSAGLIVLSAAMKRNGTTPAVEKHPNAELSVAFEPAVEQFSMGVLDGSPPTSVIIIVSAAAAAAP